MSVSRCLGISAVCIVVAVWTVSAAELSRYREFELGSSVAGVTAVTQSAERDMRTIHSRPALLQEVVWQPRYMSGAPVAGRQSINEIVFSFVDDRLFRMIVGYERGKTTGLTNADMTAALSELYGAPTSPSPRASTPAVDGAVVIAEWQHDAVHVALRRSRFNDLFSLVITSLPLEVIARTARAAALEIDAREAPQREAVLLKKRADEQRQAEEQARTANKKEFKP